MFEPLILDGIKVAAALNKQTQQRTARLKEQGVVPSLATILVGADPASATYVRMKGKACEKNGLRSIRIELPERTTTEELIAKIAECNADPHIHGILLQHPVPAQIDERKAFEAIALEKDVDGVTSWGFGQMAMGFGRFPSCTPAGIIHMLDHYQLPISGKHAVVIGRSPILGKPMAQLLLNRDATVTICHSRTADLASHVRQADIVVAAVGKPKFVQGEWLKAGAVVIDAGYNEGNVGDVDYEACLAKASAITPVPGGPGPVTIAVLMKHTVDAAEAVA
jgi:methylenetetrahydrofolate dehydrogenase (NADP+) / methenyltetrahydrofolate cyclohydrolase